MLDEIDRAIINQFQGGFPLSHSPFAEVGAKFGLDEAQVIERIKAMRDEASITRFGPLFNADAMGGAFCLCAMAVPSERFDETVALVNAHREVAHNYQRAHALNMWFVLATEKPERIAELCAEIEAQTGLRVFAFPKTREFFVEFRVRA
ncbi:AsnC family transcriptional regulator [Rhodoblastus sp. 17X3]|uniref:Lrp/AsnC family transcriptional regulator n=1 Tax=Rhodoblastus sp. 17X3 TaxID=3047026 RepID=UPI0024B6B64B|nr:AsnC family transcriptional regulator [Rhodoblastus sp. 17X3]MDI9850140.1 AsnC family transcriptional regulator [Rhodoblastus sp. 17X3]